MLPWRNQIALLQYPVSLRWKTAWKIRKLVEEGWKRGREYGKRWTVEAYFSGPKGETIRAKRTDYMAKEIGLMVHYYNSSLQFIVCKPMIS